MNPSTIEKSTGPVRKCKFPWADWLKGTAEKPIVLTFGKDVPAGKTPAVLTTQLHQWAKVHKLWAYTSVAADKKTLSIYTEPIKKNLKKRPDTLFPYPKQSEKKPMKKSAKSKAPAASTDAVATATISPKKTAKAKPAKGKAKPSKKAKPAKKSAKKVATT